ncbi:MAG: ABC transporter permease [Planctomycetota bacterium]|jgi:lipoprotein-releasing system permease protein
MLKLFFWLRYLRKKKIVLLSIASVALAAALLIVVASLFGGFIDEVDRIAPTVFGDIYLNPWVGIPDYEELLERLEELPQVEAAAAVLDTYGLLHLGSGDVHAVRVVGIDPAQYSKVTGFKNSLLVQKQISSELTFAPADDPDKAGGFVSIGIFGKPDEKTDKYDFEGQRQQWLGKDVVLTTGVVVEREVDSESGRTQRKFKSKHLKFNITDIVFVGMYFQDSQDIYLPIEKVLELAGGAGAAGKDIKIKLAEGIEPEAAIEPVRQVWIDFARQHNLPEYAVSQPVLATYKQMLEDFVGELKKQLGVLMLIFGVVCSVGVLLIFCIFYMIVMTRLKDIAVIKSCGAARSTVASIFIGFGICVGVVGSAIGITLGYFVTRNINVIEEWVTVATGLKLWKSSAYMFSTIPNEVDVRATCWIVLFTILASALGALIPAIVAARTKPIDILRYE